MKSDYTRRTTVITQETLSRTRSVCRKSIPKRKVTPLVHFSLLAHSNDSGPMSRRTCALSPGGRLVNLAHRPIKSHAKTEGPICGSGYECSDDVFLSSKSSPLIGFSRRCLPILKLMTHTMMAARCEMTSNYRNKA